MSPPDRAPPIALSWQLLSRAGPVQRLVAGTGFGGAALLFNRGVTMGSAIVFTRMLGVQGYGVYAFAIASMGIIGVFCELGLATLLVREVARAHARHAWDEIAGLLARCISIFLKSWLVIAVVGAVLLAVLHSWLDHDLLLTMALMLLLLALSGLIRLFAALFNGLRRVITAQFVEQALAPGLLFLGAVALYLLHPGVLRPQFAMAIQLASATLAVMVAYPLLAKAMGEGAGVERHRFSERDLIRRSRPFLLISSAILLATQLDTVLVNLMLGNEATGLYRVASQGAVLLNSSMQVVASVCLPYFARLFTNGDIANLRRLYRFATVTSFGFAAALFALFYFEGELLIRFLFGAEYVSTYPMLLILSGGYLGYTLFGPAGALLTMSGYEMLAARTFWSTAILNLVAGVIAAANFGVAGVAVVTATTIALNNALLYLFARRKIGV
jgi:O-antigen/teichoic acid export membrane protein